MKSTSALGLPPTAPFTPNHSSASSSSQVKKSFVFGSSTPRELSHIDKVSRKARLISSGSQPLGSNKAEGEELHKRGPDISFYMRKARSITPAGGRGDKATSWAFGSSTPRELSHLKSIRSDQRVYDAKVNHKPDVKSFTSSYISYKPASHVKPQSSNSRLMSNYIAKPKNSRLSDDASSEPDIVQDRSIDFHRKAAAAIKLVKKSQETINKDKKITKGSSKAVKESTPKKSKEPVKPKSNEEKKIKKNTSMEKKGKLEKKSPFEEQFQQLSTKTGTLDGTQGLITGCGQEVGQKIVLLNQIHENAANEKAVRVPAIRAHDDTSEVLLDDQEITAETNGTSVSDAHKEENKNANLDEPKTTLNSENSEARTLSPLKETQDSDRST